MFRRCLLSLSLVSAFWVPAVVLGQYNKPGAPPLEDVSLEGTVFGVARGQIQMKTSDNKPYQVFVPQIAQVRLIGTATVDFLRSGLYVEFVGDLDEKGKTKKEVEQLTIFTPSAERQSGLYPEAGCSPPSADDKDKAAGAGRRPGGDPGIAGGGDGGGGKKRGKKDDSGGDLFGGGGGGSSAKAQAPRSSCPRSAPFAESSSPCTATRSWCRPAEARTLRPT